MECHEVVTTQSNSAGIPIKQWRCYCKTTACLKNRIQNYNVVERVEFIKKDPDCDCEYEYTLKDGSICRKCQDRFYKKVLKNKLI